MKTALRTFAALIVLALIAAASAQTMKDRLSYATILEIQEAAAFTDGVIAPCPDYDPYEAHMVCVDTTNTYWSTAEIRDWSDYGLSGWRIHESWTRVDSYWRKSLVNFARNEILLIAVTDGLVVYLAGTGD